ncbi:MAG: helix-turn-helix transcriptional regulator, partial [Clostridia bacterium]|nr:helix-turn-helix transcriptional regulator [Clostridia bacterium]
MDLPIGKNIKELRQKAGLTQRALANDLQVSVQAVSKWEQG